MTVEEVETLIMKAQQDLEFESNANLVGEEVLQLAGTIYRCVVQCVSLHRTVSGQLQARHSDSVAQGI